MCLFGESSDAIIFRKSRIKFHETYCTKLLIPRILLFRHKDLKNLSRERSRAKIRNFKIVVQKSNFKTQQHTNLTYPFQIPKGRCKFNPYLLISAGNRRFFVRRKRAKFKNRKSFERAAVIDAVILLVSVLCHLHVLWNQTSLNPMGLFRFISPLSVF